MSFPNFFNPKESEQLFGLREDFDFFKDLFIKKNFQSNSLIGGKYWKIHFNISLMFLFLIK